MGSEDASGNRRELLEDPRCLNMVLQERVARSHIVVFNGCFVAVLETHARVVLGGAGEDFDRGGGGEQFGPKNGP